MDEIVKHINDTNASYRQPNAGDAKNTDLFLDNEHYQLFEGCGDQITVRYNKENLTKAILFIASILPRKFDQSTTHELVRFSKEFVLDQLAILDALFVVDGKPTNTFTQVWNARKDVLKKNGETDKRFYFNGLLKDVAYTNHIGKEVKTKFTIRNYFAGGYSNLHIIKALDGIFDIHIENTNDAFDDNKESGLEETYVAPITSRILQKIFYGAPGTGKSHTIKEQTSGEDVVRTTFHPDSDYSTFVGAYKPTTKTVPVTTVIGTKAVPVEGSDGKPVTEEKIVYEFVSQVFLQAYIEAWQKFNQLAVGSTPKDEYLIIEEINRGNCAQIFGDLFQLLDRDEHGFSEYPIKADADMQKQLQKAFNGITIPQEKEINALFKGEDDIVSQVLNGEILLLPSNLYIWATMNTSDQSLFPIDSAFKRRWDWTYVPISDAEKNWRIEVNGVDYDWWQFLVEINKRIYEATFSEDKKLGYFFCKAENDVISAEKFVSKVVFYLWNDVFKDTEFEGDAFKDEENEKLSFDKFYITENGKVRVNEDKVEKFLNNLDLKPVSESVDEEEYDGQEESTDDKDQGEWTETEKKRYEYWDAFLKYASEHNHEFATYFGGIKKASKDHWKNFFVSSTDFYLVAIQQRRKHAIEMQVYYDKTTEEYHKLYAHKDDIEQEMGTHYEWEERPKKKSSIISEEKQGVNFENKEDWPNQFDYIIDRLLRMRNVFLKYAKM